MTQSWRKIKIDKNDVLYSKIIRYGKSKCLKCEKPRTLQCCHIMRRGHHSTRFLLEPKPNAIAMCSSCHDWADSHWMDSLIFDESKRVFNHKEESYTFLVEKCGYTWEDIQTLKVLSNQVCKYGKYEKEMIHIYLKKEYDKLAQARSC